MLIKDAAAQAATSVRETYWSGGFPVDPDAIAHRLGIMVMRSTLPPNTSGMIIKRPGEDPQVLIERQDGELRQRFTVAHELGHYIERTEVQKTPDEDFGFVDVRSGGKHDMHEFFANEFAANLLMPESEVRVQNDRHADPIRMAGHFGVSLVAMKTRLLKLGLLPA